MNKMPQKPNILQHKALSRILIYGAGIAANQVALALSKALESNIELVLVTPEYPCLSDVLYGGITSPESYDMNLKLNLSEPELFLNTNTSFSFGSHYQNWGPRKKNWVQCHHLPFPSDNPVDFHQLIKRHKAQLSDYLISAIAATEGKFAHPPAENPSSALSRAEYGYHFDHHQLNNLLTTKLKSTKIKVVKGSVVKVELDEDSIDTLTLESGETITADLYLDCSGINSDLLKHLSQAKTTFREVNISYIEQKNDNVGNPCRTLSPLNDGWQAKTSLRGKNSILTVTSKVRDSLTNDTCLFVSNENGIHSDKVALGHQQQAWVGNCISLGHAACTIEPLTPAPMKLLGLDILRLLELIPVDTNMKLERQEYNRRFINDVTHAELFNKTFYDFRTTITDNNEKKTENVNQSLTSFWQYGMERSQLLDRKIIQFLHRGNLVSYDLEPFNQEDWAILHYGMGRSPERSDRLVEIIDYKKMQEKLDNMKAGILHLVSKMPPHSIYLSKFLQYLKDKY